MKSPSAGSRKRYSLSHLSALDSCTYRLMKLGPVDEDRPRPRSVRGFFFGAPHEDFGRRRRDSEASNQGFEVASRDAEAGIRCPIPANVPTEILKMICEFLAEETSNPNLPTHVYRKEEVNVECCVVDYCGKDCWLPCEVQRGKATLWHFMKSFRRARAVASEIYWKSTTHLVCASTLDQYGEAFLERGWVCRKLLVLVSKGRSYPIFWLDPLLGIHKFLPNAGLRFRERMSEHSEYRRHKRQMRAKNVTRLVACQGQSWLKGIRDEKIDSMYMTPYGQLCLVPSEEYMASSPSVQEVRSDLWCLHERVDSAVYLQIIPRPPPEHTKDSYITDRSKAKELKHTFWRKGAEAGHIEAVDVSWSDGDIRIVLSQEFLRSHLTFESLQINRTSLHKQFSVAVWARLFASDYVGDGDQDGEDGGDAEYAEDQASPQAPTEALDIESGYDSEGFPVGGESEREEVESELSVLREDAERELAPLLQEMYGLPLESSKMQEQPFSLDPESFEFDEVSDPRDTD
ncbi:hypothetical protein GQ53DRAFT_766358 [Thozetella sp. PMI_491]|nr:hypothetical protein GQ53DRAFT_766358 [Thozetella sp. PMI_491]